MARLTKEERAELEARLAEDEDDDSDEVEIGLGEGKYFRGSYKRARSLGYVKDPRDSKDEPDEGKKVSRPRFASTPRTG
jgi:hypothetical protein